MIITDFLWTLFAWCCNSNWVLKVVKQILQMKVIF